MQSFFKYYSVISAILLAGYLPYSWIHEVRCPEPSKISDLMRDKKRANRANIFVLIFFETVPIIWVLKARAFGRFLKSLLSLCLSLFVFLSVIKVERGLRVCKFH